MGFSVIFDCYTDEPSGYGVRPFLGSHQIHLSQALQKRGIRHKYVTIEDVRYNRNTLSGESVENPYSRELLHTTKNRDRAIELINGADTVYIVMGCFVDYEYFSSVPPKSDEVYSFVKRSKAKKVLFFVSADGGSINSLKNFGLVSAVDHLEPGNAYRYVLEGPPAEGSDFTLPNYGLLATFSNCPAPIVEQLHYPVIAEIETGSGCNTPTCSFCIEAVRKHRTQYREPQDIIGQVRALYDDGVRHFRLGRQPNFYHYQHSSVKKLEELLDGIRSGCPDIETLHIDNVNMTDVLKPHGEEFTRLIAGYCTAGNVAPFGIESFDGDVRSTTNIGGTADEVIRAMEIINKHGQFRDQTGFPRFLPGVNLIYGLPGQSAKTHEINLAYLRKILEMGLQSQRLFFRLMTRPSGVSFANGPEESEEYRRWSNEIVDTYVLPMQRVVYPEGTVLKGFREAIFRDGHMFFRTMGTCSIRAKRSSSGFLKPYDYYDIEVKGHLGPRLLDAEIVRQQTTSGPWPKPCGALDPDAVE